MASSSNSNLRSSSSLPNLLLCLLNLTLLLLAATALGPVFLLRPRPTSFGWALASVSAATLLSALLAFYSQLTHLCFAAHVSLAVTALSGQALASLALFLRRNESLQMLGSVRDGREQFVLVFLEEVLLVGMFLVQAMALVVACAVSRWWAREYEAAETEKAAVARKRSRKMARVQAEAAAAAEAEVREMDEKVRSSSKQVQWAKNGFEEC